MSKALLPVLPAGQRHLRAERATRPGHGRPGSPLGNDPVPPEKREGKGKEKDLGISILHAFTYRKVECYEIGTTRDQTTNDSISLIQNKAFVCWQDSIY